MSDDPNSVPVTANLATGAVTADTDEYETAVPRPDRTFSNILWLLGIGTLCLAVLILVVTIAMKALAPADATSDANLGVLVALVGGLNTALVGFFVSQRRK